MNSIAANLAKQYPDSNARENAVEIKSSLENMIGDARGPLRILLTAVGALLLIACANVAGLLLARGSSRQTELAVRAALGASRGEITLQLLAEALILSLVGGAAGVVIATTALKGILYFIPKNLPRLDTIAINGPVLAFAIGISMLTGIVFGLLPARRLSRLNPAMAMQDSARTSSAGRRQSRLHSFLVIAETATGLVLLIGAGLLIHSFCGCFPLIPDSTPAIHSPSASGRRTKVTRQRSALSSTRMSCSVSSVARRGISNGRVSFALQRRQYVDQLRYPGPSRNAH